MTARLRFWLLAMDFAHAIGAHRLYLFTVSRASDATDWGPPIEEPVGPWPGDAVNALERARKEMP
jgi:hypothetical protein